MKILVIEDNPTNMKLITSILKKTGYEILQAENADKGIEMAIEKLPHLILMDIQLPGKDGLTATKILKNNPKTSHIKIIALTAFAMKGDKERILKAGCDGYILKPIRYKEFLKEVELVLKKEI